MNTAIIVVVSAIVLLAAIYDARSGIIPDRISLGGFGIIILIALFAGSLQSALFGAAVAGGAMGLLFLCTRGHGLGLGDVKLSLAIGAALGPLVGLIALGLAFIFGAIIAIALLLLRRIERGDEMYFAPYLAAGTIIATIAHIESLV